MSVIIIWSDIDEEEDNKYKFSSFSLKLRFNVISYVIVNDFLDFDFFLSSFYFIDILSVFWGNSGFVLEGFGRVVVDGIGICIIIVFLLKI